MRVLVYEILLNFLNLNGLLYITFGSSIHLLKIDLSLINLIAFLFNIVLSPIYLKQ